MCIRDSSYSDHLDRAGLVRLEERREEIFKKFAIKSASNTRFCDRWFPKKSIGPYSIRNPLVYEETHARTERLKNSPLFQMRKRLNNMTTGM